MYLICRPVISELLTSHCSHERTYKVDCQVQYIVIVLRDNTNNIYPVGQSQVLVNRLTLGLGVLKKKGDQDIVNSIVRPVNIYCLRHNKPPFFE